MSDELHKYPGNLKHHKVDAPAKRKQLLSDEQLSGVVIFPGGGKRYETEMGADEVRNIYEAARAKDAELIQRLVDVLAKMAHYDALYRSGLSKQTVFENWQELASEWHEIRQLAAAAGFKPSEQ